jgi:hypothetical protein
MRLLRSLPTLLLLLPLVSMMTGCQAIGVVADKISPPTVEAQYAFGKTTQVLVIAENFRTPTQSESDADRVAQLVSEELTTEQAALIVSPEKLALVRDVKPDAYAKMSVVDLGRAVGAQQVLYIDMGGVGVGAQPGSDVLKGVAQANVKIIDVATGAVAFPKDMAEGVPVSFETVLRRASLKSTPDAVRTQAIVGLSGKIARLFHKYYPADIEVIEHDL